MGKKFVSYCRGRKTVTTIWNSSVQPIPSSVIKYNYLNFIRSEGNMGPPPLIEGNYRQTRQGLGLTVGLGIYFTILQGLEYYEARFTFADRVYGSTFFIATGFYGLHVIVGTIFLMVTLFRHIKGEFRASHHFGFEAAAWY